VTRADGLVAEELRQHLARTFAEECGTLERQWDQGDEISTDDLRTGFSATAWWTSSTDIGIKITTRLQHRQQQVSPISAGRGVATAWLRPGRHIPLHTGLLSGLMTRSGPGWG
jgi:hypothetical protein